MEIRRFCDFEHFARIILYLKYAATDYYNLREGSCLAKEIAKAAVSKEYEKLKENLKNRFISSAHIMFGRDISELPMSDIYKTVAAVAKQIISENWIKTNKA